MRSRASPGRRSARRLSRSSTGWQRTAAETLRRLRHVADLRVALWSLSMAAIASAVPLCTAYWILPSRSEIAALSARRDALDAAVARLKQQGGEVELRRC